MPPLFWLDMAALSISAVITTSIVLIVSGTAPRRGLNRSFALFALMEAAWIVSALFLRLSLWLEPMLPAGSVIGNSLLWLEMTVLTIGLMSVFLLRFTVLYLGRRTRRTDLALDLGLLLVAAFSVPLFRHQLIFNPRIDVSGIVVEDTSIWGAVGAAILVASFLWSLILFWQERHRAGDPYLALSMLILLVGIVMGGALDVPFPSMSITNTLSAAILGCGVISRQLFNPLRERTAELQRQIAERVRVEETLRQSEERLRTIFTATPDCVYLTDTEGKVLDANPSLLELVGLSLEQMQKKNVLDFFAGDNPERLLQVAARLQAGEQVRGLEAQAKVATGEIRDYEIHAIPLREKERVTAILSVARDITERKRAEQERERLLAQIQEQARRVQQIIDTVPEGVILLDTDGRVVLANPLGEKDLVALAGAKVGDTLTHLGDHPLAELLTSSPKGMWHEVETDGSSRQVFEVFARPLEEGPETEGWVLVLRDITQQREIQRRMQQQERLAAVGQLAAGIAHDFNNILTSIIGFAALVRMKPTVSQAAGHDLDLIIQEGQRAARLTRQILDFSRQSTVEKRPLDLAIFLKETVKLLKRTIPENIRVTREIGPGEYLLNADPACIQQAFMNLAINARDAMPEGGNLHIGLERIQIEDQKESPLPGIQVGEWVRVTVSDSGMGIPPDVLPHIFEPFFTTKPAGEGTGLGLAQVWGIVKQHEGHIDVATKVGEGTTFTLYLPALQEPPPETLTQDISTLPRGQGETILVVEDDPAAREVLVSSLETLNYRALEAANGREALEVFERHAGDDAGSGQGIALVLSDRVMPEMGGAALLRALRNKGWMGRVILMTGHLVDEKDGDLQSEGVVEWLQKPVSLEQLAQVVARVLSL